MEDGEKRRRKKVRGSSLTLLVPQNQTRKELALSQIGDHLPKIVRMPSNSASTQNAQPTTSATTGQQSLARMGENSIGREPGVSGAVALLTTALREGDADRVNANLKASLPPGLRSRLDTLLTTDFELEGFKLTGPVAEQDLAQARSLLATLTAPSTGAFVAQEVSRCLTGTKSRERDQTDLRALIEILTEDLMEFPPDIVKTALRKWAQRETWWPSQAEIRAECQWRMKSRRALAELLR